MSSSGPVARPPYASPRWLSPRVAFRLALAWPVLIVGGLDLAIRRPWERAPAATIAGVILVPLLMTCCIWVIGRSTTRLMGFAVAFGAAFASAAACVIPFGLLVPPYLGNWPTHDVLDQCLSEFWGPYVVLVVSIPLGLWLGALAAMAAQPIRHPSHESTDALLVRLGLGVGIPAGALIWLRRYSLEPGPALAETLGGIVLPLLVALGALGRLELRRRWLASVVAGKVAGWRVEACEGRVPQGVLPWVRPGRGAAPRVRVLVTTRRAADPFRELDAGEMVALVADEQPPTARADAK